MNLCGRNRQSARKSQANGFTLIQVLLVLLIASVFLLPVKSLSAGSSGAIQMEALRMLLAEEQMKAFVRKEVRRTEITASGVQTPDGGHAFVQDMACLPAEVYWNENGAPGKAATLRCTIQEEPWKLVIGLGSGRMHYEKESQRILSQ